MARHTRLEILTRMKEVGLVPLFYNPDIETAKSVVQACFTGGASVIEFTNRGDRALDVFRELAICRDQELPELILGGGSIVDAVSPTRENLTEWFSAGAACVGIGSKLITKELVAAKDYPAIQKKISEVVALIREIRQGLKTGTY